MKKSYLISLLVVIPILLFAFPNPLSQTYVCDLDVEYEGTFKSTPSGIYLTDFNISSYNDHNWEKRSFLIFRLPDIPLSTTPQNHEYDTWVKIEVFLRGTDGKKISSDQIAHFGFKSTVDFPEQKFIGPATFRDIEEGTYQIIIRSNARIDGGYTWISDPITLTRR